MRVRFVDIKDRFMFEHGTLAQDKDFSLRLWNRMFGFAAEAKVQLDHGGVSIRPSKGELQVNDQPVQVSATLKHSDTVFLRADNDKSATWEYQEDFTAAKQKRQETERSQGIVRRPPNAYEGGRGVKWLANKIRTNEQGIEVKSFFRWKQLRWDQLDWIEYARTNSGAPAAAAAGGGWIGGLIATLAESVRDRAAAAKADSEFVTLFDRGFFNITLYANDKLFCLIHQVPAASCVWLCEALEHYAPFDLLRSP